MADSKQKSLNNLLIKSILFALFSSITAIILIIFFWGSNTLTSYLKKDSSINSQLVFTSMQELMKKGTNSAELQNYVNKLNIFFPDRHVTLKTEDFQIIKDVEVIEENDHIKLAYPLKVEQSCLACHTDAKVGDLKGVIEYRYPIKDVFFSLQDVLLLLVIFAMTGFVIIFIMLFLSVHRLIAKPLMDLQGVMDKVSSHNDLQIIPTPSPVHELEGIRIAFNRMSEKLSKSFTEVVSAAETDTLTGLRNRRNFDRVIKRELIKTKENETHLALVMLDLNRFKPINDTYGHQVGDHALKHFAAILEKSFRKEDLIFRTGGDEFMLILPNISNQAASHVLDTLSKNLTCVPFKIDEEHQLYLSCSMGFAIYPLDGTDCDQLIETADQMMYVQKNKNHGEDSTES
ncbi:diguanylate cyclase domain-containing protein [Thiomicrorhabdus sp. Milos-T2]|uniref:diguanylate cyclase domain-containing protein n=1 Tax=Thiomicrorhabdus sp. Milos-T2 TaxID=90814 RepID=UPI00068AE7A2|nr:diguanylate cyclase [Thiomicrorhabdus sp. Milos-T2]